ncbi:MAG: GTP cyclohydrolase II [Alphaproteobacteria bacterium]|nr:GTP cyclohydrolase II [Alphaproteobacteria bacterium]
MKGRAGEDADGNQAGAGPARAKASVRARVRIPLALADGETAEPQFISFTGLADGREHFAIHFHGPVQTDGPPTVRLHSECVTGDVFGSARCDCGRQLGEALGRLAADGGYLLYLRQEGRGIGLYEKLDAYLLQNNGYDTFAANRALGHGEDERTYGVAAEMLTALGVARIALLSNNPDKRRQLEHLGIEVTAQIPTGAFLTPDNRRYLEAKAARGHHLLDLRALKEEAG